MVFYLFAGHTLEGSTTSGPRFNQLATDNFQRGINTSDRGLEGTAITGNSGLDWASWTFEIGFSTNGEFHGGCLTVSVGSVEGIVVTIFSNFSGNKGFSSGELVISNTAGSEESSTTFNTSLVPFTSESHFRY